MALFCDDDLGLVAALLKQLVEALLAFEIGVRLFIIPWRRPFAFLVIFFAIDERDHIGVLLDRSGFTQIGELWPFVLALLDRARELTERDHRNIELLGQRFQSPGNLGDFLDPVVAATIGGRIDQLEIVDDDQAQTVLTLEAARAGPDL
jgi:hypothetical protein